jgi:rare lipoprotein A
MKQNRNRPWIRVVFALCSAALLAACGSTGGGRSTIPPPTGKPYAPYMVGKPYTISGRTYYPRENLRYDKTGIASWYGKKFHGRRTANGEHYDMNAMTAAHPTLPMPTIVRVKNLENGRSVVLRVNDRGPFVADRIIDVSRRAAERLGFIRSGTVRVRVTVLRRETLRLKNRAVAKAPQRNRPIQKTRAENVRGRAEDRSRDRAATPPKRDDGADTDRPPPRREARTPPAAPRETKVAAGRIFVHAGSFSDWRSANRAGNKLSRLGRTKIAVARRSGVPFYQVRVGPVSTAAAGDRLLARVVGMGYPDARVVVD